MKSMKDFLNEYVNENKISDSQQLNEASELVPGNPIKAKDLVFGKQYFLYYKNSGRVNVEVFTFQGFSDQEQQYGKSGPKFKSLKDVMTHYGFKTMKNLEDNNQPHGNHVYMCTKEYGCVFYPFNGRWSVGGSANKLSFYEAVSQMKE